MSLGSWLRDVRFGLRQLGRNPGFAVAAVLTLALGVGANSALFTALRVVFGNPLPLSSPSQLLRLYTTDQRNQSAAYNLFPMSYLNFLDVREHNGVFDGLAAFTQSQATLTESGQAFPVSAQLVSGDFFSVLGIQAQSGRSFDPLEVAQDAPPQQVAVISHSIWANRLGGDPGLLGRAIRLNAHRYTVIGIAPVGFKGVDLLASPDQVWLPLASYEQVLSGGARRFLKTRRGLMMSVVGRLKPGFTREQAAADLDAIARRLESEYPSQNRGRGIATAVVSEAALGMNRRSRIVGGAVVLAASVALVLLMACVNVAGLLLARLTARSGELSIRATLGAGRKALLRQMFAEGLLLAGLGGIAGLALGLVATRLLWRLRPSFLPADALSLSLDLPMLLFTLGAALTTAVLIGLIPALRASGQRFRRPSGRGMSSNRGAAGLRHLLVGSQIALSVAVLITAVVFIRSLSEARQSDVGFRTDNLVVLSVDPGAERYSPGRGRRYYQEAVDRVRSLPGVEKAALASNPPFGSGSLPRTVVAEGQTEAAGQADRLALVDIVSLDYFETLGIPLQAGRLIHEDDDEEALPIAVINRAMGRRFWPGDDPMSKRFRLLGSRTFMQVVGVVEDTVQFNVGEDPHPVVYLPLAQHYTARATLYVLTDGAPEVALVPIQARLRRLDPNIALVRPTTMRRLVSENLWAASAVADLLAGFGLLGLTLACVGVYGVASHSAGKRAREVAVRTALGGRPSRVSLALVGRGSFAILGGAGAGLVAALFALDHLRDLLYGSDPLDPIILVAVPAGLAATAFLASFVAARRASRANPADQLR